jgi:hypothetical protein
MKVRSPERRLRIFTALCQGKRVCEHTGGPQPTYRLEHGTLKIQAEFPAPKGDDAEEMGMEAMERKQVGGRGKGLGTHGQSVAGRLLEGRAAGGGCSLAACTLAWFL